MLTCTALVTPPDPNTGDLVLEDVSVGAADVTATLRAACTEAPCPPYSQLADRIHSRHHRTHGEPRT